MYKFIILFSLFRIDGARSNHDFSRHLFADGDARLFDIDNDIAGKRGDDRHISADNEAEIFKMQFNFGAASDFPDGVDFSGCCKTERHHFVSSFRD